MKVDYDGVKDQFKQLIGKDDDFTESPTSESFPSDDENTASEDDKDNLFSGGSSSKGNKKFFS